MAENTKIEWCSSIRADGTKTPGYTWSPWRGCVKVSAGCLNCYAERLSHRNPAVLGEWGVNGDRVINADWNKPLAWDRKAAKLGERHRVFPSLCDPFEDRPDLDEPRTRLFSLIEGTPNLDWLLLTKRPENVIPLIRRVFDRLGYGSNMAREWLGGNPPRNVWMGVSVENQEYADKRLSHLMQIPAFVRWVSYEPALELVNFARSISIRDEPGGYDTLNPMSGGMRGSREVCGGSSRRISWIVCGGESGHGARPFDLRWAEAVRDQCKNNGTAFYMKQVGSNPFMSSGETNSIKRAVCEKHNAGWIERHIKDAKGGEISEFPENLQIREFPKARS